MLGLVLKANLTRHKNYFELFSFVYMNLITKCLYESDTLDQAFEALFTDIVCGHSK